MDGTDINDVCRSQSEPGVLASADDFGRVRLFTWPVAKDAADAVVLKGHSSHVTRVRFSRDDLRLFSAGGNDQCVFQWRKAA